MILIKILSCLYYIAIGKAVKRTKRIIGCDNPQKYGNLVLFSNHNGRKEYKHIGFNYYIKSY